MIRKVNIPLTASQFKQRATLLRLIRFSHKDNFVLSVCKRNVTKTNSYFLSHICWRAFASQHTILYNSAKKPKFVWCKIRNMWIRLVLLLSRVFTPVQWNHVKRTWSGERNRTAFELKANKGLLETTYPKNCWDGHFISLGSKKLENLFWRVSAQHDLLHQLSQHDIRTIRANNGWNTCYFSRLQEGTRLTGFLHINTNFCRRE